MKRSIIISFTIAFIIPIYFYGWGEEGHKIIAKIAELEVKTKVRNKVQKYLGLSSFEQASVWMDSVRSNKSYDYMKPWHYVNVVKDSLYVKHPDGDIVSELDLVINELKNYKSMSDSAVTRDLKILFHLCGDLTQPLHAGYASDRGGNDVVVTFINGKQLKLHRIWDKDIIVNEVITLNKTLEVSKKWSGKETKIIKEINVINWMNDSRAYLPSVYNIKSSTITQKYLDENKKIIEGQLAKGGLRLAEVLNDIFK
jgi:hypothetical protein